MSQQVPEGALVYGFVNGFGGTHTSRTIMLAELRLLIASTEPFTDFATYRSLVVDENVLLKSTMTTRLRSLRGLRELYSLDQEVLLFRALRALWDDDAEAQPLLALLSATARDPVLRGTADWILGLPVGTNVTPGMLSEAVSTAFPERYNAAILSKIGRNAASSWQQSGHLQGRLRKVRTQAEARPTSVTYALLLGYLCGARGDALLETLWARLLDAPVHVLREHALAASRRGWLDYRHAGSVTDITFHYLLRDNE